MNKEDDVKKIYVASSWKNANRVRNLVYVLRSIGFVVYDFTYHSFNWADLNQSNAKKELRIEHGDKLSIPEWFNHPKVCKHFQLDLAALNACDLLIAIFPCGKSTHLEVGFVAGRGKEVYALSDEPLGRDLLYKLFKKVFTCEADIIDCLEENKDKKRDEKQKMKEELTRGEKSKDQIRREIEQRPEKKRMDIRIAENETTEEHKSRIGHKNENTLYCAIRKTNPRVGGK